MLKKFILPLFITLIAGLSLVGTPAFADDPNCYQYKQDPQKYADCLNNYYGNNGNSNASGDNYKVPELSSSCRYFLGMVSWDCNVEISDQDSLKTGVWTIAMNVLTDITVIAAYLVIGYVIYGGYLYVFSAGDPGKVATGKKALYHAFLGLAIVLLSNVILNTIRIARGADFSANCVTSNACLDGNTMVTNTIHWVTSVAGIVAAIFVVYGGISYVTSAGEPSKLQKAKQMITYALIGLAIIGLAEIITAFVGNMIRSANTTSSVNETIISKEVYENKIN